MIRCLWIWMKVLRSIEDEDFFNFCGLFRQHELELRPRLHLDTAFFCASVHACRLCCLPQIQWAYLALSRKHYTQGLDSDLGYEEDRERNKGTIHIRCRHFWHPPISSFFDTYWVSNFLEIVTLLPLAPIVNVFYGWSPVVPVTT